MIVDGKSIAAEVLSELEKEILHAGIVPVLTIITCAPNFETKKYLALKEQKAHSIGVVTNRIDLPETSTTDLLVTEIRQASANAHGVIVQLPLPAHIDTETVLRAIPVTHDVDALNPDTQDILSPVVRSFAKILGMYAYVVPSAYVTIVGSGRLVGLPAYRWFQEQGAHVSVVTKDTESIELYTKQADIVVLGAGKVGLLRPQFVKDGVVILDAGTSEDGGELRGDADPLCAEKARIFTPVPGGIGPITIAMLLANVVLCAKRKMSMV
jgi:methylenetetrahydrofolate dehydrogenase (NADP+) / methenyltetrahydrofolate cyclohydrolase